MNDRLPRPNPPTDTDWLLVGCALLLGAMVLGCIVAWLMRWGY